MIRILREDTNEIKEIPLECIKGATLLSKEEVENLLTQEERKCKGTEEAINNGLWVGTNEYSPWRLRSASGYCFDYYNYYVNDNGYVSSDSYVSEAGYGIRLALIINLKSSARLIGDKFEFGDYTFTVISDNLALCDVIIDACPFNRNKKDGNNYEKSDVKKYVDRWFDQVMNDYENKSLGYKTDDEIWNDDFDF